MSEGLQISLAHHTAPELGPVEAIEVAKRAGYTHVGVRLAGGPKGEALMPIIRDRGLRRAVADRLRAEGIGAMEAGSVRLMPATDPDTFAPICEVAAEIGARFILSNADDPEPARLAQNLGRLTETAAAYGMETHFEFVSWSTVPNLAGAIALREMIGRDDLKIALDALHFDRSGGRPAEIAAADRAVFGDFHLCDAAHAQEPTREQQIHVAVHERLLPGEGDIDLSGILSALPPGLPILVEVPSRSMALKTPALERASRAARAARAALSHYARSHALKEDHR